MSNRDILTDLISAVYFDTLPGAAERARVDLHALERHIDTYIEQGKSLDAEWLFLNVHPASLLNAGVDQNKISRALTSRGIRPEQVVIEVLESSLEGTDDMGPSITRLRELGCLIALDDFGAGHSNFERVFDLKPHIVKLDRKVLLRAKDGSRFLRIVQRMVSILHECGSMVLMEGIETIEGAHIALTCDVDFVQGYYFGRPEPLALAFGRCCDPLDEAWRTFDVRLSREEDLWRQSMAGHCDRLRQAAARLSEGAELDNACASFLAPSEAAMCYLLDEAGLQVGTSAVASSAPALLTCTSPQFEPIRNCSGAKWSRRQYFRRALSFPGQVQLTRPYLTLYGGRMCFTVSIAFEIKGRVYILCGDLVGTEPTATR